MDPSSARTDRETTSPSHIQVFYRAGAFPPLHSLPPASRANESAVSLFTWPSATLYELSLLLTPLIPPHLLSNPTLHHNESSPSTPLSAAVGTRLAFRLAYPAQSSSYNAPKYISKDLGIITIGSDPPSFNLSLEGSGFTVGDYLMLAILRENEVAPPVVGQRTGPLPRPLYSGSRRDGDGVRMPEGQWARGGGRGVRGGGRYGDSQGPRSWGRRFGDGMVPHGEWRRGEDLSPNGDSGPRIGYQDDYRDMEGGRRWESRERGRGRDRW